MSRRLVLARTILARDLRLFLRYPGDAATSVVSTFVFFLVFAFGVAGRGGPVEPRGLVVGFFLWSLATTAYGDLAGDVRSEATHGTLEQLYLTPLGFGRVVAVGALGSVLVAVVRSGALLVLMVLATGESLSVAPASTLAVLAVGLAIPVGTGLGLGGLALVSTRVDGARSLVQLVFLVAIGAGTVQTPVVHALPLTTTARLLGETMVGGNSLVAVEPWLVGVWLAKAATFLAAGVLAFRYAERVARDRGALGDY